MALDREQIRRLLNEVASTKAEASAAKAQELLDYVRRAGEESRRATAFNGTLEKAADPGGASHQD